MSQPNQKPEPTGINSESIADAVQGNWVDRYAPPQWRPYLRLSRADRPIGTWLLLLPCWWGLLLAMLADGSAGWRDLWLFLSCAVGAFLMRGAGCTWNDITDRHIDGKVARTALRPIPSGQVTTRQALIWMVAQALIALLILLTYNRAAIVLGIVSLLPVAVYPFAKRFTWWPQVFLGIAFNWGALLLWAAHSGSLGLPAIILYLAGISWTLFYDTIYALQDVEDDALIGVKSTARLFGDAADQWLLRFLVIAVILMATACIWAGFGQGTATILFALLGVASFSLHLYWQLKQLKVDSAERLLRLFRSNRDAGLLPLPFLAIAVLL